MAHHIIYVPGLGDHRTYGQNIAIQLWRLCGLKPHYYALGWNKKEYFSAKLDRLIQMIEVISSKGNQVSLIGVSAGASAVLNAYSINNKVNAVVLICGKVNHPETVSGKTYRLNPDFEESMHTLQANLTSLDMSKRQRIMSIHPWRDKSVPIEDTIIDGATEKTLPGWGHMSGIFFGVALGGPLISGFIKKAAVF